nr:efflux RND transporter periplasmic adaptor subunit [Natronobacillus azotifigens]
MGEVEEVHVANGDRVEEDDILITIISFETGMEVEITAPADGQVSDLSASEGSILSTEEPVSMIVNLDELTITADVTATNVNLFEVDQEVDIHFSGDEDRSTATVVETSLLPGETGLYEVTLTAENANDWKAGMVATIFLTEETISDTLIIPTAALIEDDGEHYVFVVEDNRVTRTEVTISNLQSDITAVDGEIEQGDLVVTSGQLTLSDGSQVIIVGEDGES